MEEENDRLPELKLERELEKERDFAMAGMAKMPRVKTAITKSARIRLTQVQGRTVPHPPGFIASPPNSIRSDRFLLAFVKNDYAWCGKCSRREKKAFSYG